MGAPILIWLLTGAATVVALQLALVLVLLLRGAWASQRVARWRRRSRILDELLDTVESNESVHVRRELACAELGRDLQALEGWIDRVVERGEDPAQIPAAVYEDAGLVQRHIDVLSNDRRWTRRAASAAILGWTQSPQAVPLLLERVQDVRGEMPAVRAVALRALGRLRHPDAVAPLVDALCSEETWLPPAVAAMLTRLGTPALEALVEHLRDDEEDDVVRRWCAQILGDMQDRRALPALLVTLNDVDAEVRARSAHALGAIGDERAADRLIERLLVDPVPFVRVAVARALGNVSTERAMQRLVEALADPEWWVRLRAIEALESIGAPARDLLVASLSDPDPQIRRETARALEGIGVMAEAIETIRRGGYDAATGELLVDIGRAGNIEPLLDELESDDVDLLRVIVRILGRIEDPRAGVELVSLLDRIEDTNLRARIVEALVRTGDGEHVERVLALLQDVDGWVRKEAVSYVAAFGDESVLDAVLPLVDDANPWTREAALRVLERVTPELDELPRLVARIDDEAEFVRAQAVRTLCAMRAFDALVMANVHVHIADDEVRDALIDGLQRNATPDALVLVRRLGAFVGVDDLTRVRRAARTALDALDVDETDALIEDAAEQGREPSDRWLGAVAWQSASDDMAQVTCDFFAYDGDPRIRAAMMQAIATRPPQGFDRLVARGLQDDAPHVVRSALAAAAELELTSVEPILRKLVMHEDSAVRVDAILAQRLLSSRPLAIATQEWASDQDPEARLARAIGDLACGRTDAILPWIELLDDGRAMRTLDRWIAHEVPLITLARKRAQDATSLPVRLLACRTPFDAERILIDELETSPEAENRRVALEGIAAIGSERGSGRVLAAFMRDHDAVVRARALRELVTTDAFGRGRQFLEQAFLDPEDEIQIIAAQLCAGLPDEVAVRLLVPQLATRRPVVLRTITDILAGVIEEEIDLLLDAVGALPPRRERLIGMVQVLGKAWVPVPDVVLDDLLSHRFAAVRAETLVRVVPRRPTVAFDEVVRGAADPAASVREAALRLLVDPRLRNVFDDLERLHTLLDPALTDPSPRVRSLVALALGKFEIEGRVGMIRTLMRDENERVARIARRVDTARKRRRETPA